MQDGFAISKHTSVPKHIQYFDRERHERKYITFVHIISLYLCPSAHPLNMRIVFMCEVTASPQHSQPHGILIAIILLFYYCFVAPLRTSDIEYYNNVPHTSRGRCVYASSTIAATVDAAIFNRFNFKLKINKNN